VNSKFIAATASFVLTFAVPNSCGAKGTPNHCQVETRTTTELTIVCYRDDNGKVFTREKTGTPSDLYPKCQVGQPWPKCKEK
jgi:hypothetical protein